VKWWSSWIGKGNLLLDFFGVDTGQIRFSTALGSVCWMRILGTTFPFLKRLANILAGAPFRNVYCQSGGRAGLGKVCGV